MNLYDSDLIRGSIDTIILNVLIHGDNYGYNIIKEIYIKSGNNFELKEPTLYSCLRRLESQKIIESYWGLETQGARRKYYKITKTGKELYKDNYEKWNITRNMIDQLLK